MTDRENATADVAAQYKMYIDGLWVESETGEEFNDLNPASEESIGKFPKGNEQDVNKAVDAAEDALRGWSETPAPTRGKIVLKAAALLGQSKEFLAREITLEMGKVLLESRGEVQEAIDVAEYMAGEGRRLLGSTTTSELKDKFAMTIRKPIGVVGLISPWNFPISIPAQKMFPALVCGNTVVFKPSSDSPRCGVRLVEMLEKAGVPKGVANLVTGSGDSVGMPLVRHRKVRAISFTGNRDTGAEILKNAGIKRVGLELGGKNGTIVMDDADLDSALEGVLWGGYGTTGQRCTATSRAIVHEDVFKQFEEKLVERVRKLKLGNGLDPETDVGPLVNKAAQEKCERYVEIGLGEGAKILCGGRTSAGKGFFFEPTLFTECTVDMKAVQEEIFGPVVCLLRVADFEEAIDAVNSVEYGLSASVYTSNPRVIFKSIERIEAGVVYVNAPTIGAEVHLPFGGVKHSGTTREGGIEGILEFSETKTVYVDYSGKLQRAQIDVEPHEGR
jgi:aldehyde dehydrogenase (NAD+)